MRLIMELTSIGPGLWDIMVDVGSAANPKVTVVAVDGFGAKANIPHDAIAFIYTRSAGGNRHISRRTPLHCAGVRGAG